MADRKQCNENKSKKYNRQTKVKAKKNNNKKNNEKEEKV